MKIGLCAQLSEDGKIAENLGRMEAIAKLAHGQGLDLILFGEAYLQGFEAFNFDYAHDVAVAVSVTGIEVAAVRKLACQYGVAIGFGFYENARGALYASYLIVDQTGATVDHYRRVSTGWRIPEASADYREGNAFHAFQFQGKMFSVLLCGDFWEDGLLTAISDLDAVVDAFFWPVHCDFQLTEWQTSFYCDYVERSRILAKPLLFVNNYRKEYGRAKGGAYIWQQGQTIRALPYGEEGLLIVDSDQDFRGR